MNLHDTLIFCNQDLKILCGKLRIAKRLTTQMK
jgi:hypothetical protein